MTPDLETQLARYGDELDRAGRMTDAQAGEVPVVDITPRRSHALVFVAAAVVLALVVASFAIIRSSTGNDRSAPVKPVATVGRETSGSQPIFPTPSKHRGPELFLAPRFVPSGYSLIEGFGPGGNSGGSGFFPPREGIQYWVKLDDAGTPRAAFTLSWQATDIRAAAAADPSIVPTGWDPTTFTTDVLTWVDDAVPVSVPGKSAIWSEPQHLLAWNDGGKTVYLAASGVGSSGLWPEQMTQAEMIETAARVEKGSDGGFAIDPAPTGYRFAGQQASTVLVGNNSRKLMYSDGADRGFSVTVTDDTDLSPGSSLADPASRLVKVGSLSAVLAGSGTGGDRLGCSGYNAICGGSLHVQWLARDGSLVTVSGLGLDEATLLQIARSLRTVDTSAWQRLIAKAQAAPTTIPTVTTPPATLVPDSPVAFATTTQYVGIEYPRADGVIPAEFGLRTLGWACMGATAKSAAAHTCPLKPWTWLVRDAEGTLLLVVGPGKAPNTFRVQRAIRISGIPEGFAVQFVTLRGAKAGAPPDGGTFALVGDPPDSAGRYHTIGGVWTVDDTGTVAVVDDPTVLEVVDPCTATAQRATPAWCS